MEQEKKNVYLRVSPELKAKLKQIADRAGLPLHSLLISVLWQYAESKAG